MKLAARLLAAALTACLGPTAVGAQDATAPDGYWPTEGWRTSSPEAQGMDARALVRGLDFIRDQRVPIHSLLVIRNGHVVLEAYFHPFQAGQVHDLASATKSVTATLVGIAIGEHRLSGVQQPVLPLFAADPDAGHDARKDRMTVEHLLTMTSGLDCEYRHGETTLDDMRRSADWLRFMLDRPMVAEPGTAWAYCSGGMHLLSGVIARVTGGSAFEFAQRALFRPLGMQGAVWPADPQGVSYGWGDLHLLPRDMAKLGYLWLHRGRWGDLQVVPADWMEAATRQHAEQRGEGYGYGMWVYPSRVPTIYEANGRGGQRISVVPAKNLIVVMTGGGFEPGDVGRFILEALGADGPIPENPAACSALTAAVTAAAQPPQARPAPRAPSWARRISGRRYSFDANAIGLASLTLTFSRADDAVARLSFADGRVEERAVGLDGVPRLSAGGRFGLPVALTGSWQGARTFDLWYDEVANINALRLRLSFRGKDVVAALTERTGLLEAEVKGRRDP
ncbi:MAG TPA: serine hydrolase [Vicinamibacteria bacterium]|nr:serine hydrolase [Vicinamibacteria bacterium]